MYNAQILAHSISPQNTELCTMKITFPRIVLAEFNTHRIFSRNSASSRAIPFKKMVKMIEDNPFVPIAWQKDHKGMQGIEYITDENDILDAREVWNDAKIYNIKCAKELNGKDRNPYVGGNAEYLNVTKQLCNRLLEPFMWHTVIITSSTWSNFFELRCPKYTIHRVQPENDYISYKSWKDLCKDYPEMSNCTLLEKLECNKSQADIHIQAIAELMWDAYNESIPKHLQAGDWHIPNLGHEWDYSGLEKIINKTEFISLEKDDKVFQENMIKIATGHCAKISYDNFGTKVNYEADIKLHDRLAQMKHWSPFEHCARAMSNEEFEMYYNGKSTYQKADGGVFPYEAYGWCRNFKGFIQYRHLIENQNE